MTNEMKISLTISEIIHQYNENINNFEVLSLDCFDTILWRNVHEPIDIFNELELHPLYREHGLCADSRKLAERSVRREQYYQNGHDEITIFEIYRQLLPHANDELIHLLALAELEEEKKHLFAYTPFFELMADAKKKGKMVIITSDMYLSAEHIRDLVGNAARKAQIEPAIDYYFTSADHRTTKSKSLFNKISNIIGVAPKRIMHIGDNMNADLIGARRQNVTGIHFRRLSSSCEHNLRKNAQFQRLLDGSKHSALSVKSSWHSFFSHLPQQSNTIETIGWNYLAPILLHYCQWLFEQAKLINASHEKDVKLVFLLRDSYLAQRIFNILSETHNAKTMFNSVAIHTSRQSSIALGFKTKSDVLSYLAASQFSLYRKEMIKQLSDGRSGLIDREVDSDESIPWDSFIEQVCQPEIIREIIEISKTKRVNFINYFKKIVDPKPNEILVFADLGYNGTIQDRLQPIIFEEFGIECIGRYLILRAGDSNHKSKAGLIDYRQVRNSSIELILSQIQTLEQLTVNDEGSTKNYTPLGSPQFENQQINSEQLNLKKLVQEAAIDFCIKFAKPFLEFFKSYPITPIETMGLIARLVLQPTSDENSLYAKFVHDINNGSYRQRWLSNHKFSKELLIRGGLFSYHNDRDKMLANDLGILQPSLAYLDYLKSLTRASTTLADFRVTEFDLNCGIQRGKHWVEQHFPCFSSFDGFKIAIIKDASDISAIGFNFGKLCSTIQLHSISAVELRDFVSTPHWIARDNLLKFASLESGSFIDKDLIRFDEAGGFIYVDLKEIISSKYSNLAVIVIFRDLNSPRINQ